MFYLAHLANLPKGLYILPVFFFIFFLIFNGPLSGPSCSEAHAPIFTKISGLVDKWKGWLTSFSFFQFLEFSKDVAMATN